MELYNKYEKAKVEQHFDRVSVNYDAIYKKAGYPDPEKCAEFVDIFTK